MAYKPGNNDALDELMRQADEVLKEDDGGYFHEADPEDLDLFLNYGNNYGRNRQPGVRQPVAPEPEPREPAPAIPAYNVDFMNERRASRPAARQPAPPARVAYEPAPAYEPEYAPPAEPPKKKKKRRKKHRLLKVLLVLALLVGGLAIWLGTIIKPPETDDPIGPRKSGAATILLCGTDEEGTRTDTMMLLYLNAKEKSINLVSLPRDSMTLTTAGDHAKLNSAFGRNDGKADPENGMEELMGYVADIIGYRPDGYMLISLDGFVDIVDIMGGVEFDVPQDMFYEDPSQDLYIDLKEGLQTLNGTDAMGLVRFRKGYANQDLGRVEVQREFISACMDQWLKVSNVAKLPKVLSAIGDCTTTDLSKGNMLWIALTAWRCGIGNIETATLPGYADNVYGASYYILDRDGVAELVNGYCNPYEVTIDASDLNIVD